MTILAVYYTFADLVLLGQCFYYRGWTLSDLPTEEAIEEEEEDEERPLLWRDEPASPRHRNLSAADADTRRPSTHSRGSFNDHLRAVDGTHLSPATPLLPASKATDTPPSHTLKHTSTLSSILYNTSALLLVCAAGVFGWWLSARSSHPQYPHHHHSKPSPTTSNSELHLNLWGQIFGYLCAALYLGSRIPQLLLNHRRKSTEGVSMLFFLFACVGNLTYVLSIVAYEPSCARVAAVGGVGGVGGAGGGVGGDASEGCGEGEWGAGYARYMLVNASWLVGSAGTLGLDLLIFAQFWVYRGRKGGEVE